MNIYKITNNIRTFEYKATTLEEAQVFANNYGDGYTAYFFKEYVKDRKQQLSFDISFGGELIMEFLLDNRNITPSVTTEESIQLANSLNDLEKLARLGDIKSVQLLVNNLTTDDRLITQERKDKYLTMIDNHLNQYL